MSQTSSTPTRVLVMNARRRNAIPVARALAREGFLVACADSVPYAATFYSRACAERFVYPDPAEENSFIKGLVTWLRRNPCDVVLPLDDDVLEILSRRRQELPNPAALLLPDHELLLFAGDKSRLVPYAEKFGIAVPRTIIIKGKPDLAACGALNYPVITKPAVGSGSRGVARFDNEVQLRAFFSDAVLGRSAYLVQEAIPERGEGLGYFALFDREKRLMAQFMHRRLREYPISGGPSTLRESWWDPGLAKSSRELLESLGWVGLAMVEYKMDPRDRVPKLMEINPRLWGSVALPIFAGVNFPALAARVTLGEVVEPVISYPLHKKARWLSGDMLHLIESIKQGRIPEGFFRFFDKDTCYDILSLSDPLPAVALVFSVLLELQSLEGRKHYFKR